MTKIKKVLIEEDRLNKPKYLETFEHKEFVYGLEIHLKVEQSMRVVGELVLQIHTLH